MASARETVDIDTNTVLTGVKNQRGIPQMTFLEDIDNYIKERNLPVETLILALNTMHSKYKLMEASVVENKKRLKVQIPDIENSLASVKLLQDKRSAGAESFSTFFNLADQVYAKAEVVPDGAVNLWLGANVMLQYTYEQAIELLEHNLLGAQRKQAETDEDMDWLKDQITTTEVNMARAYNYDVHKRREAKRLAAVAGNAPASITAS